LTKVDPKRLFTRPRNIFFGWWIVTISASADVLKHGTFNRGFTLYVLPISKELGVGVAAISLAEMLGRMEGGLQGPLIGWLNDRFGPRAIMIFGGVASGVGFILLSATQNYVYFLLVFVGLVSLGFRAGYSNATMPAINQWFRRHRSLAMSVASMGSPLGGMVIAPLMGLLAFEAGWRTSAFVSGTVVLAVVLPLSFFVHRSPESRGLLPDGDTAPDPDSLGQGAPLAGTPVTGARTAGSASARRTTTGFMVGEPYFTVREAMRTSSYWLLVLAVGFRNTVHSGTSFLLAPLIVWFLMGGGRTEDHSLRIAALMVGLLSLSSLILNPIMGWLGDSWSKQRLSALAMVGGSASLLVLLNHSGHLWQAVLFVVLLGFSETANPLAWAIMGDFFGRRNYATLRGWQHLPDQLMSMSTPVWMGVVVDQTGSYKWALIPLVAIYLLAAVAYLAIPRPKPPVRDGSVTHPSLLESST
jgi:MFS family permease